MRTRLAWSLLLWMGTAAAAEPGTCLVQAAREQIGVTLRYDPAYQRLAYPGGDVPIERGVCTDVVVRAYRQFGVDLQVEVHQDMRAHFPRYPRDWGLQRPDRNIDHRRVPNLETFFARHGEDIAPAGVDFEPGDLVTWRLPNGAPHIGIVSDRLGASGDPLVIHNIGWGTQEEDVLRSYRMIKQQRYRPDGLRNCEATSD